MRTVLALDLSSKTGWAEVSFDPATEQPKVNLGTIFLDRQPKDFGEYPFNYLKFAQFAASEIWKQVCKSIQTGTVFEAIVIEETCAGKNNLSQRILEFIHYCVLECLGMFCETKVVYVRTGVWRKTVGANLNAEEKSLNAKISRIKRSTRTKLAKIDGKVVGRRTRKHSALRCFAGHFGYELSLKQNDACDAALLGLAYLKGAAVCDGVIQGNRRQESTGEA